MTEIITIIFVGAACTAFGIIYVDRRINELIKIAFAERCTMCQFRAYAETEFKKSESPKGQFPV